MVAARNAKRRQCGRAALGPRPVVATAAAASSGPASPSRIAANTSGLNAGSPSLPTTAPAPKITCVAMSAACTSARDGSGFTRSAAVIPNGDGETPVNGASSRVSTAVGLRMRAAVYRGRFGVRSKPWWVSRRSPPPASLSWTRPWCVCVSLRVPQIIRFKRKRCEAPTDTLVLSAPALDGA